MSTAMLPVNIGIQDRLINDNTGKIKHIEFAHGSVCKVYIKFSDKQTGSKAMRSSYLDRQNFWVPVEKCETGISIKKGSASLSIKRTQLPSTLVWASTVHKHRGLNLVQGVIDFNLRKQ